MTLHNPGRLAIHRRSDEIAFLQHRLRTLNAELDDKEKETPAPLETAQESSAEAFAFKVSIRQRDLADELLHTRQIEPLGETLQRRLAMAERICRDLAPRADVEANTRGGKGGTVSQEPNTSAHGVAEVERRALIEMLRRWWDWLRES
jgi:hypothetical protein